MIELTPETKAAIGPIKINHGRKNQKTKTFDAMENVDQYIKEAQAGRVKPPKEKKPKQDDDPGISAEEAAEINNQDSY
jgi:hypothetical protein